MEHCSHCGGNTDGFKCKQCGTDIMQKDPYHACGREMVQLKCAACGKAEDNCSCSQ